MRYILDTNACIALLNGSPESVGRRLHAAAQDGATFVVSSISVFELWFGALRSARVERNKERVETFFTGPIDVLPFGDEDARAAGKIRIALETRGTLIGSYDLLIAGQALSRDLTLVTGNVREFSRVTDLKWQDWSRD